MNGNKGIVLSILAMIFGVIGLVLSVVVIGLLPSVAGLILGILALVDNQSSKRYSSLKGLAIGGLVCSAIGLLFSMLMLLTLIFARRNQETLVYDNSDKVVVSGSEYIPVEDNDEDYESDGIWATSFTPINDFRYTLDKDEKTITLVRYEGEDTKILLSPIYSIGGTDYRLVSMGDNACFLSETHITSVYIPEGVTFIGASCFNSCASLKYIYLPATIESIPQSFWGYIDEYTAYCNSVSSLPSERDYTEYEEMVDSASDAEELGEGLARAINGMMGGLNNEDDDLVVEVYFGGSDKQWSALLNE